MYTLRYIKEYTAYFFFKIWGIELQKANISTKNTRIVLTKEMLSQAVVTHTFNPGIQEAEAGRSL